MSPTVALRIISDRTGVKLRKIHNARIGLNSKSVFSGSTYLFKVALDIPLSSASLVLLVLKQNGLHMKIQNVLQVIQNLTFGNYLLML